MTPLGYLYITPLWGPERRCSVVYAANWNRGELTVRHPSGGVTYRSVRRWRIAPE